MITQFNDCNELINYYNELSNKYMSDVLASLKLLSDKEFLSTFDFDIKQYNLVDELRKVKEILGSISSDEVSNFIREIGNNLDGKVDRYYFTVDDDFPFETGFDAIIKRGKSTLGVSFLLANMSIMEWEFVFSISMSEDPFDFHDATDLFESSEYIRNDPDIQGDKISDLPNMINNILAGMDDAYKVWTEINADDIEDTTVIPESLSKSTCDEEIVKIQSRASASSNPQVFTGAEDDNPRPAVNYAKMLHEAANSAFDRYLKERYNKGEENNE